MPFITPETLPSTGYCGRLFIPDDPYILAAIHGVMDELGNSDNWEQVTGVTPSAIASVMREMQDELWRGQHCMIGSLVHYVTDDAPQGILKCDGGQHLRVDYPRLYAELPAVLIVDADNFITPTIEAVFMLATGGSYAAGATGGLDEVTLTVNQLPAHSHLYDKEIYNIDVEAPGIPDPTGVGIPPIPTFTSNTGDNASHENMPPFVAYHVGIVT